MRGNNFTSCPQPGTARFSLTAGLPIKHASRPKLLFMSWLVDLCVVSAKYRDYDHLMRSFTLQLDAR